MKREFLSGLGLEEETVSQILEEYDRECQERQFSDALHKQLEQAGAKSVKAVRALLDYEGLSGSEDGISELSERVSQLKKEHPYLFNGILPRVVGSTMGSGAPERSLFSVIRSAAGL